MTAISPPLIKVDIETTFSSDRSFVDEHSYVFSYTVHIKNMGTETVQLLSRHWFFENAYGKKYEVEGVGVIGEQPHIGPGEIFSYTSATEIDTPDGFMYGSYRMIKSDNSSFDATVEKSMLNMPRALH